MDFISVDNKLVLRDGRSVTVIEPWGKDSVRVRMSLEPEMDGNDWALDVVPGNRSADVFIEEIDVTEPWHIHYPEPEKHVRKMKQARLVCGKLVVRVNFEGWISFENDRGEILLEEFWRNRQRIDRFCAPLNLSGRELKPHYGASDFFAAVRFEAYDDEHLYGMGQYQDSHLDKKGCSLELAQRNSQASVPFVVSSRGYGFLWNNPAVGNAVFANNGTVWTAERTKKIDYWVTCGTPAEIESNYADVTGHAPMMPDFAMGFWQCKLRYRTQQEVLDVARGYRSRGLPLDVIVIDFFHWTVQGDFKFDPQDWPDPESMVRELSEMGIKLMVSVWPTIDERSENFGEMASSGLLISFDAGGGLNMTWMGNTVFFDTTNPAARKFVWEKCRDNYFKKGIQLFWLDEAEPEYGIYNFENYRYHIGPAMHCSNAYPKFYAQGFYEGLKSEGVENPLSLVRCAWAGSQKFGAVVWSGDVHSDFRSFRNQIQAGLSMNMAGIPWWTTDIGGFLGGDVHDNGFRELLVRWFEWAVFCPVMRLHGERPPFRQLEQPYHIVNGHQIRQMESGQDNEVWSFGDEVYGILSELLFLRERLRPYVRETMLSAHENGSPVMRPLFYDFYADKNVFSVEDEYMFGDRILVAPVTEAGARSRKVYLPELAEGKWTDAFSGKKYDGGVSVISDAPLDRIPVFTRGEFDIKIWK